MDSRTVRRTGTAMSATAEVSNLSTTASTRRMLDPPYRPVSHVNLCCCQESVVGHVTQAHLHLSS